MFFKFKKVAISILMHGFLLIALIGSIQNSNNKSKVNIFGLETINLPISFITGVSFISGSLFGSFIPIFISTKNDSLKSN